MNRFDKNNIEVVRGFYRHYKGGVYEVLGFGTHTETGECLVHYLDSKNNFWMRPIDMWNEFVKYEVEIETNSEEKEVITIKRFTYFENQEEGFNEFLKIESETNNSK